MDEFKTSSRIKELRAYLNMSRDDFCLKIGIKGNQLANIELKKQKMPAWYIEKISEKLPEFAYWLATGEILPDAGQTSPEWETKNRIRTGMDG